MTTASEYEAPGWTGRMHYHHACAPPVEISHIDPMWEALGMDKYQQGQCMALTWSCQCGRTFKCVSAEASFLPTIRLIWEPDSGTRIMHQKYQPQKGIGGRY